MKEIVKSKIMVGFIVFVLGITYIDSVNVKRMESDMATDTKSQIVVMNEN